VYSKGKGGEIMVTKKDLIIVALATFCLTATLFMIIPTRSQSETGTYDPWIDTNDDGAINILDSITLGNHFLTSGTPINKTELLLELESRLDTLNSSLLAMQYVFNTRITTLEATVSEQQVRISELVTELAILNTTKLGKPDYDSGWVSISAGSARTLYHNLSTTNVLIQLYGKSAGGVLHICYLGGDTGTNLGTRYELGAYWQQLNQDSVQVRRCDQDFLTWEEFRLLMWKIP
jgi:hypothetical protein